MVFCFPVILLCLGINIGGYFCDEELIAATYNKQDYYNLEGLTSGLWALSVELDAPGDIELRDASLDSEITHPVVEVNTIGTSQNELNDAVSEVYQDKESLLLKIKVYLKENETKKSTAPSFHLSPALISLILLSALWRCFSNREYQVMPMLIVCTMSTILVGQTYSSAGVEEKNTIKVVIYVPKGFEFARVNLKVLQGNITTGSQFKNASCEAGMNTGCDKCCHGNGICSSQQDGCSCFNSFDDEYACSIKSVFKILNLWTVESRFSYSNSHALYRQLAKLTENKTIDNMLDVKIFTKNKNLKKYFTNIKSISGVGEADDGGGWFLMNTVNQKDFCLINEGFSYQPKQDDDITLMYWSSSDVGYDYPACREDDENLNYYKPKDYNLTVNVLETIKIDFELELNGKLSQFTSCVDYKAESDLDDILNNKLDSHSASLVKVFNSLLSSSSNLNNDDNLNKWTLFRAVSHKTICELLVPSFTAEEILSYKPFGGEHLRIRYGGQLESIYDQCSDDDVEMLTPYNSHLCHIYYTPQPLLRVPLRITIEDHVSGDYTLSLCLKIQNGGTLFDVLNETQHTRNLLQINYKDFGGNLGLFVNEINGIASAGSKYWAILKRNDNGTTCSLDVGVSNYMVSAAEHIVFSFTEYKANQESVPSCNSFNDEVFTPKKNDSCPHYSRAEISNNSTVVNSTEYPNSKRVRISIENYVTQDGLVFMESYCDSYEVNLTVTSMFNQLSKNNNNGTIAPIDVKESMFGIVVNGVPKECDKAHRWVWLRRVPSVDNCRLSNLDLYIPIDGEHLILSYQRIDLILDKCPEITENDIFRDESDMCFM